MPDALLTSISVFLRSGPDSNQKPISKELETLLISWSQLIKDIDLSIQNCWTVVDLLRTAMANTYISSWFLEHGMECVKKLIDYVEREPQYELHVVTVRLVQHKVDL